MILLQGKGVSKGIADGPLYFLQKPDTTIVKETGKDVEAEKARIAEAKEKSAAQLMELAEKCRAEAGDDAAFVFETHAMFLDDDDYVVGINDCLESEQCNAEYAVRTAGDTFAAMFAAMDDAYMSARAADIKDITQRLLNNLMGIVEGGIDSDVPVILCADDLAPSETLQLDKSKILGFALQGGSGTSHTAILARTMGIPAICGLGDALTDEYNGRTGWIDAETGQIVLDPDEITLKGLEMKAKKQAELKELMQTMIGQEDVTLDGKKIKLYCNIGSPEDVSAVKTNDGRGIGLFRSEFLYLQNEDYPTEEQQFQAYKKVAELMAGKQVIIRTLDIGADKQIDYFKLDKEENPALGFRAVRICLERDEIFRTQLRALLRASAFGNIAIMFPMIASKWEVETCLKTLESVKHELMAKDVPFKKDISVGIMVETPASVLIADDLAELVDFFSIGTNDLTQYTLAIDRQNQKLERFFDAHHPAVLKAIQMTIDAAHRHGIWAGICGELGADPELTETFVKMGIDELSMSPSSILRTRKAIRDMD